MSVKSKIKLELAASLEIFDEMLSGDPVLDKVHKSLEIEEALSEQNSHGSAIRKCLDKFVDSELAPDNPKALGLGRKDESFPRIAYYLQEYTKDFGFEKELAFKMLISDLVKSGYDFMVLVECTSGKGLKKPIVTSYEFLLIHWINIVPDFKFENLGPAAAIFRDKFIITRLKKLGEELRDFNLFELFAEDARLQHVFRLLIIAGLELRIAEAYYQ